MLLYVVSYVLRPPPLLACLGMAIYPRKQSVLLTFKVLQFVNQLRRRVRPHTPDGSSSVCPLGSDALGFRALKCISSGRHAKTLHHGTRRVCKSRKNKVTAFGPPCEPQGPALHASVGPDAAGGQVQQYVEETLLFGFAC